MKTLNIRREIGSNIIQNSTSTAQRNIQTEVGERVKNEHEASQEPVFNLRVVGRRKELLGLWLESSATEELASEVVPPWGSWALLAVLGVGCLAAAARGL